MSCPTCGGAGTYQDHTGAHHQCECQKRILNCSNCGNSLPENPVLGRFCDYDCKAEYFFGIED